VADIHPVAAEVGTVADPVAEVEIVAVLLVAEMAVDIHPVVLVAVAEEEIAVVAVEAETVAGLLVAEMAVDIHPVVLVAVAEEEIAAVLAAALAAVLVAGEETVVLVAVEVERKPF